MNRYFEQMVLSATPAELVRLLFQKAISSTRAAREHLREKRIAERCAAINNVYLIVAELSASLRPDEAPELANRLGSLYVYIQRRLVAANSTQKDEPLAEVLSLLTVLAQPWDRIVEAADNAPASGKIASWPTPDSAHPYAGIADEPLRFALSA